VDNDVIYRDFGRLMIDFQRLENELLEINWYCTDRTVKASKPLRGFDAILKLTERNVNTFLSRWHNGEVIRARFTAAFEGCRSVGARRNRIVHSVYHYYESPHGDAPSLMRTYMRTAASGTFDIEYEEINDETLAGVLRSLTDVYGELFALHRELMYSCRK
jgi:hypothetical protein